MCKPSTYPKNLPTKRKQYLILLFPVFILLFFFYASVIRAQGNLVITPRRVVFDGKAKTQVFNFANNGKDTVTYLVSMKEMRMTKYGKFEEITQPDSDQRFASSYVRFNPRRVRLAPDESQIVRIQISKAALLQPGEYRSHLLVRPTTRENEMSSATVGNDSTGISVHLIPNYGIYLPVIIQVGQSTAQVSISDVATEKVSDTGAVLSMVFNRTGNMSVYGDVKIEFIALDGKTTKLTEINGVAVYTPGPSRHVRISLCGKPGVNYHSGKLHIVYAKPKEDREVTMAEAEYLLH